MNGKIEIFQREQSVKSDIMNKTEFLPLYTERENKVKILRDAGKTYREIANLYGVSIERIRQISNKAFHKKNKILKTISHSTEIASLYITCKIFNFDIICLALYMSKINSSLSAIEKQIKNKEKLFLERKVHLFIINFLLKQWESSDFADFPNYFQRPSIFNNLNVNEIIGLYKNLKIIDKKKSIGHRYHKGENCQYYYNLLFLNNK